MGGELVSKQGRKQAAGIVLGEGKPPLVQIAKPIGERGPNVNAVACEYCGKTATAYHTRKAVTYYKCIGKNGVAGCGHTFTKFNSKKI